MADLENAKDNLQTDSIESTAKESQASAMANSATEQAQSVPTEATNATNAANETPKSAALQVFTSNEKATSSTNNLPNTSKQGSHFFGRLLFLLVGLIALPLVLCFFITGLSLCLATLICFFACFVLLAAFFAPELLPFLTDKILAKPIFNHSDFISLQGCPYLATYFSVLSEEYKAIIALVILIFAALLILVFAFLFLKIAKAIWRGLAYWRHKLSA